MSDNDMRAKITVVNFGDTQAKLEVTMSVDEWLALRKQMSTSWPSSELYGAINKLINDLQKTYTYQTDKE